jgi:dienelactone hydrolase
VSPALSLEDEPIHLTVSGLPARKRITLELRSVDANGVSWRSNATFLADASGVVNLDRTAARSGSYTGVWNTGLLVAMKPLGGSLYEYIWRKQPSNFRLIVTTGSKTLASVTFQRKVAKGSVVEKTERLSTDGFIGHYYAPRSQSRHTAVLAFGGSEGGDHGSLFGSILAGHGYPTLTLAYFKAPGLPQTLSSVPLEYFAKALQWLRRQPGVDPNKILILGASRGSEAALLLGVHYPDLVHGVVASVPSNVAICSFPGCTGPAWTLHGKPIPYTKQFDDPAPTDNPAAVIPVERIRGPVFLFCGPYDSLWSSCPYSDAIVKRLEEHHDRYRHVLYVAAPPAGHFAGGLVPYEPGFLAFERGGTEPPVANEKARERIWPKLLAFLAHA